MVLRWHRVASFYIPILLLESVGLSLVNTISIRFGGHRREHNWATFREVRLPDLSNFQYTEQQRHHRDINHQSACHETAWLEGFDTLLSITNCPTGLSVHEMLFGCGDHFGCAVAFR